MEFKTLPKVKKLTIVWILFYTFLIIAFKAIYNIELYELIPAIILLGAIFLFESEKLLTPLALNLLNLTGLMHILGVIKIGESSLYGSEIFLKNYDLITHFYGFLIATIGVLIVVYHIIKPISKPSKIILYFVTFLAIAGVGSMIEIGEYGGFAILGYGDGAARFGEGDYNKYHGAWGDSSTDQISNTLGIIMGFAIFFSIKGIKNKTKIKRKSETNIKKKNNGN